MALRLRVAGHVVAQADRRQRDEAVVKSVQVGPGLDVRVDSGGYKEKEHEHGQRAQEREHDVHMRTLQSLPRESVEHRLHEFYVELEHDASDRHKALYDCVEQEQRGRYADDRVCNAEDLAQAGLGVNVAVADGGEHRATEEDCLAERPVGLFGHVSNGRDAAVVVEADQSYEVVELRVGQAGVVTRAESPHVVVQVTDDLGLVRRLARVEDQRAEEQVEHVGDYEHCETLVGCLKYG